MKRAQPLPDSSVLAKIALELMRSLPSNVRDSIIRQSSFDAPNKWGGIPNPFPAVSSSMSDSDFSNLVKGAFLAVRASSIDGSLPNVTVKTPDGKIVEDTSNLGDIDDTFVGDLPPDNYVGDIMADNGWTGDDMLIKFIILFEPLAYKGIYKVSDKTQIAYPTDKHHLIFNLPLAAALIKKMKGGGSANDVLPYQTLYVWDNPLNTKDIMKVAEKLGVTLNKEKDHKSPSIAAPNAFKSGSWVKRLDNMVCYSGKFSPTLASYVTAFVEIGRAHV